MDEEEPKAGPATSKLMLKKQIDEVTTGSRALELALASTRVLDTALGSSNSLVARLSKGYPYAGLSTIRAFSEGIYGHSSTFSALSEAIQMMQEPYQALGGAVAEAARRAMPTFDIPLIRHDYAIGELAGIGTYQNSLAEISTAITRGLAAAHPSMDFTSNWGATLPRRLELFRPAWSIADADLSIFEFGRLARLSDAVHTSFPYSPEVTEYVAAELEDANSDDDADGNGFEIFVDDAIPSVTLAAGFSFTVPVLPLPRLEDGSECDGVFDPAHHSILTDLEQRLRRIIVDQLTRYDGTDWTRKIPGGLIEKWSGKQEADRARGIPVLGLIHYSDFAELADIIISRGNWNNAFSSVFKGQQEIAMSLRHLSPIRNAVAHSRPLSKLEAIWLVAEATRIYIQLGIPAVNILR